MDLQTAVFTVLGKYADFTGRARRSEYWYWALAVFGVSVVIQVLAAVSGLFKILSFLFFLAVLVPGLAVAVRRMQDVGKPWPFLLISFIPFGVFYVLYLLVQDSEPGANTYGPSPKSLAAGY